MANDPAILSREQFLRQGWRSILGQVANHLPDFNTLADIAQGPVAVIELTQCTAYQGSGCQECYTHCPLKDDALILVEGLPQVVNSACTGCGDCLNACPTPGAIISKARHLLHNDGVA